MEKDSPKFHKTNGPRVSIGLPVYNAEYYLEETLSSLLNQTYSDFLLYISDNASTDRTGEICLDYANRDDRIVYIENKKNLGAAANYSRCFMPATSEYYRWQNADDTIEPELIEECLVVLDAHPDAVLAYGKSRIMDGEGKYLEDYDDNLNLLHDSPSDRFIKCRDQIGLQHLMYGLIRRESLAKTALIAPYIASDMTLICELSLYGKFIEIPRILFNRRMHEESCSWDKDDKEKQKNHWDPSKRQLVFQNWISIYEHYKAVTRAPISINEKMKLYKFLIKYTYWNKDSLISDVKDTVVK